MKVAIKVAGLFLALSLAPHAAVCQERAEDSLNGYAIHVTYRDHTLMFWPLSGASWHGGAGFTTTPGLFARPAARDSERVTYVEVGLGLQDGLWRVTVSLKFGEFYDADHKEIATYQIREGEKVEVKEAARYGLKPFDISVVRVERVPALQPTVANKTDSIAVLDVKTAPLPMPYRIVLQNTSDKAVQALEVVVSNEKGESILKWPEGTWSQWLIEPGQEYTVETPSEKEYRSLPGSGYLAEQLPLIQINTVVFADGTYEGKPDLAMWQRARAVGSKLQIDRILTLIQNALETGDDASALERFKEAVSSLGETAGPEFLEELRSQFQGSSQGQEDNMRGVVRSCLHNLKAGLKNAIAEFESGAKQAADNSFKTWLEGKKEAYESWRSRLP
ncbi:MAG TPA: hypothetical protein VD861_09375 [Pyrinomonadaceae bacterium]|nr:hypothetical protein [Pyrinomonadaceae bacterium]